MADETVVNFLAAYLDREGITLVKMIDPVDHGYVVGLDVDQVDKLVNLLLAERAKVNQVRAYAQHRVVYGQRGVVQSSRIASDLGAIVGGVKF